MPRSLYELFRAGVTTVSRLAGKIDILLRGLTHVGLIFGRIVVSILAVLRARFESVTPKSSPSPAVSFLESRLSLAIVSSSPESNLTIVSDYITMYVAQMLFNCCQVGTSVKQLVQYMLQAE